MRGLFPFLKEMIFGMKTKEPQCAALNHNLISARCSARSDPRCLGGNCTEHCNRFCAGKCRTFGDPELEELRKMIRK